MTLENIFRDIYVNNTWTGHESKSGPGSGLRESFEVRTFLQELLPKVKSILDVPCGDYKWFNLLNLGEVYYEGWDCVDLIIADNLKAYPKVNFKVKNIINETPPKFDLILCRDLIGHLTLNDGVMVLNNLKKSNSTHLLATTYLEEENVECETGGWRRVVLTKPPYNLGKFEIIIQDGIEHPEKKLALWKLN